MKKFILHITYYGLATFVLLVGGTWLLSSWVERQEFKNWNTDSNLLILKEGKQYDYLFLGNSHARNFSRHGNHLRMEKEWSKSVLNLGQGRGICGPAEQNFYLSHALSKGVKFDRLIMTISPPYIYGEALNRSSTTFYEEPFRFDFLFQYLRHGGENMSSRVIHYLRSKWRPLWINLQPSTSVSMDDELDAFDSLAVKKGFDLAFPLGKDERSFLKNAEHIESAIEQALVQKADVTLLSTPTLFGHWPGQKRLEEYIDSVAKSDSRIEYLDLSNAIDDPSLYYDHHHLNSTGMDSLLVIMRNKGF